MPKLCGADIELGNFYVSGPACPGSGERAARALLAEFDGVSCAGSPSLRQLAAAPIRRNGRRTRAVFDPQDWGRRFLPSNGGCVYIDLEHLELCLPEVLSAHDHVAAWHAMLSLAQDALAAANGRSEERIEALVNNSDGLGSSYGSHLDFLVSRRAWENLIHRRPHYLASLAAFQASLLVLTGQGKVGAENGREHSGFQLSQRADFLETLLGLQTTFRRPLVNTRDEPLCGIRGESDLARLHVICFDNTLCQVGSLLKVGCMQIALAMLEAGEVDLGLALEDPVEAVQLWSLDPTLRARVPLAAGGTVTAVELQRRFAERAERFVARGECDAFVPGAAMIVTLWDETLGMLERGDWTGASRRLDWALKLGLLERAMATHRLRWESPETKVLDHRYAALDPSMGLYWACDAAGLVDRVVGPDAIARFRDEPPDDTRAFARARWLRAIPRGCLDAVDWDSIRFRWSPGGRSGRVARLIVNLVNPLGATRSELAPLFDGAASADLATLIAGVQRLAADRAAGATP